METLSGKGEGWGKRYWKEDYLLKSGWEWHTTAIWHLKIIEIILHLLHQLQNWPCSALSYKDSTYIMQLEFWFIPWLFRAWTIAIMFVPSYSFFFVATHYKAIQSFPACFVSHCSTLAVRILFSPFLFSYVCSITYEINIGSSMYYCNHSRTSRQTPTFCVFSSPFAELVSQLLPKYSIFLLYV